MLAEDKLVQLFYNILFVLGVLLVQHFNQLGFDESLFVESLLVFEDLERHKLLFLVVKSAHHNSEGTLADFFNNFVTVVDVIVIPNVVLLLVCVVAVVGCFVYLPPVSATCESGLFALPLLSFGLVEVVDGLKVKNFSSLVFR